jgi:hypothetical protein
MSPPPAGFCLPEKLVLRLAILGIDKRDIAWYKGCSGQHITEETS